MQINTLISPLNTLTLYSLSTLHSLCLKMKKRRMKRFPTRSLDYRGILANEAANKISKNIVHKMVFTYKDWHEMLPTALHGFRTSVCASNMGKPISFNIQHGGRASSGGQRPVDRSSVEIQAWLNLNA